MKGIFYLQEWFGLILTGIIAVGVLPLILPSQVTKISPEVEAKEFENRAILLANSVLSHPDLLYQNNKGLFDESTLNDNMVSSASNVNSIIICKSLCQKIESYPSSLSLVVIKDIESGNGWIQVLYPNNLEDVKDKLDCFSSGDAKNQIQNLLKENSDIAEYLNLKNCDISKVSHIFNTKGFPVAIRYGNEVHVGWLKTVVIE